MISDNNPSNTVLSDSAWQIVLYIVECSHLESFPGLFELIHRYHTCSDWNEALHTSNGSRAWHIAACRSFGSAPPFLVEPMTVYDVESAVHAFLVIFNGGYCSCGGWTKELPVVYEDGIAEWSCSSCQVICKQDINASEDPFAWQPQAEVRFLSLTFFQPCSVSEWGLWRMTASKAMNDPASLSSKRLKVALKEWLEWSSCTWEDVQASRPVTNAFRAVNACFTPLSSNGCETLAKLVMEHFTELKEHYSDEEDLSQWDDALKDKDDDENTPVFVSTRMGTRPTTPTKVSPHVTPLPKSPFGNSVANRVPVLVEIERKGYV